MSKSRRKRKKNSYESFVDGGKVTNDAAVIKFKRKRDQVIPQEPQT